MSGADLTLRPFLRQAVNLFPAKELVSRSREGVHRCTYDAFGERVAAFASSLADLGVEPGDRVGTFGWNHHRHLEAYFAVPLMGAQLHTINVRLPDEHVEYIVEDASDDLLLVDPGEPLATIERLWPGLESVGSVVVMSEGEPETDLEDARGYEPLVAGGDPGFEWPDLPGDWPAGMCYTSGTTGLRRASSTPTTTIDHAWGMTETMSVGSYSRPKAAMEGWSRQERFAVRQKQGLLSPGLEMKVVGDDGEEAPWDGESFGELWVRGPTVVDEYYNRPDATEESFEGEWLKTGDIVTVDEHGYIEIVGRAKGVIKSGGEWISSIELENALMARDDVAEAAVVGVEDDRWQKRPVAFVVPQPADPSAETLREFLAEEYPRWWLPDNVVFIDEVPKTATGKFDKKVLRNDYWYVDLPWTPSG